MQQEQETDKEREEREQLPITVPSPQNEVTPAATTPSSDDQPRRRSRRRSRRPASPSPRVSHSLPPILRQLSEFQTRTVTQITDFDRAYFNWYAHLGIHEEMIKDSKRTEAYVAAINHYKAFINGKVVLDVGCGTGILSILCAKAGARRVYAVEASNIALQVPCVVKENHLSDIVIVLHGRVEDVKIHEKVDVIISEWMGYMLLNESMLGSVITARDRWLKPGGLMIPSSARLFMAPVTHDKRYSETIDYWRNVYGIDMSAILPLAKQCAFGEPAVETITPENVLTYCAHLVRRFNCHSVTIPELETVTSYFRLKSKLRAPLHGFAFWFDVHFDGTLDEEPISPSSSSQSSSPCYDSPNSKRKRELYLNNLNQEAPILRTGPDEPPTHWQQSLVYLFEPIEVEKEQPIRGSLRLSRSQENARCMNIRIEFDLGVTGQSFVRSTVMK